MIKGCAHGPKYVTGDPCPDCEHKHVQEAQRLAEVYRHLGRELLPLKQAEAKRITVPKWRPLGKCQLSNCDGTRFTYDSSDDPRHGSYFCEKCGGMQVPTFCPQCDRPMRAYESRLLCDDCSTPVRDASSDEDDVQFAFRLVREFLDKLDAEIVAQPSGDVARTVAIATVEGIRAYVNQLSEVAASAKQSNEASNVAEMQDTPTVSGQEEADHRVPTVLADLRVPAAVPQSDPICLRCRQVTLLKVCDVLMREGICHECYPLIGSGTQSVPENSDATRRSEAPKKSSSSSDGVILDGE